MMKLTNILYPTDFSGASQGAFEAAASLARDHKARLTVVHVIEPEVYGEMIVPPPPPTNEEIAEEVWKTFHKLEAEEPKLRELRLQMRVEHGDPSATILRVAQEVGADMIVMGTHGRGGFSRLLFGSVAERVLRGARCPVMTVRSGPPVPVEAEEASYADV